MKPAARQGDKHVCPEKEGPKPHVGGPIAEGSSKVLIDGQPAARKGDQATCVGPPDKISEGSSKVKIENKEAARMGDGCDHGGKIVEGCKKVLIGG
ncbi:MAG: PAAR domain-containing protein [Phycisphaerae bacterium]